jgi:hypothetical protein
MADQEVIKHTKKVYKIWNSKEHKLLHKIKELFIEILIIVFAITLSIWLHDKSVHSHQQKEVKEFLVGLKEDLLSDAKEMENDKDAYLNQGRAFKYISSVKLNHTPQIDSLRKYQVRASIFSVTQLQQNNGRFEGFKSSGKIGTIEDKKLQNNIMDLYQENIPLLLFSTNAYLVRKRLLVEFYLKNYKRLTDSTNNIAAVLSTEEAQTISILLANTNEIINRYNTCIGNIKTIILQIEAKYKE